MFSRSAPVTPSPAEPSLFAEPVATTDVALVEAACGGDASAFDELVRLHHRRVFNFLRQMTRQHQDAEDLTQQTFIKGYTHLARFDPRRPLITWLLTIARHNALNHFRSARRWEEVPEHAAGGDPSPADAAETSEHGEHLWAQARALLSRREFEVLWLRFGEELSIKETASVVGLTQTHVKVLVFRARRALQKGVMPL